jgi:hypothetical protein
MVRLILLSAVMALFVGCSQPRVTNLTGFTLIYDSGYRRVVLPSGSSIKAENDYNIFFGDDVYVFHGESRLISEVTNGKISVSEQ